MIVHAKHMARHGGRFARYVSCERYNRDERMAVRDMYRRVRLVNPYKSDARRNAREHGNELLFVRLRVSLHETHEG